MAVNKRKNLLARIVTPGGDNPLLLEIIAPSVVRSGVAVSGIALVGSGGTPNYVFSIVTGSLPTGLSLNGATGAITGTPTTPGTFAFVAQIQDSSASVYTASFSITVFSRLIRKHKAMRNGEVDIAYLFQMRVVGNTGSVTWSIESGNLPAGLSLDSSTGIISGTPSGDSFGAGGISYFTARATDGGSGETLDIPDKIKIFDLLVMPSAPRIVVVGINRYFEHQIAPTGGTGVYFYSLPQGESLPLGIKFENKTGLFRGIPIGPKTLAPWSAYISVGDAFGRALYEYLFVVLSEIDGDAPEDGKKYVRKDGDWEEADASGGGSVDSVGGVGPDSSGDIAVTSPDGSIAIGSDSSGALTLQAVGGGGGDVSSVAGQFPDSSGDIPLVIQVPIQFGAGSKSGAVIPTGTADAGGIVSYEYTLGEWTIETHPAVSTGTFVLDIRRAASGSWPPTGADSICGGSFPTISTGVEATGDASGFADNVLNPGDAVDCVVTTNTAGVRWFRLAFAATRPI